ncbi:MAG: glycosyl hydrolase family 32 [Rhodoluna sp.]
MALRLEDKWIWDSWYTFDGERYHAFYLHASRALGDPVRRHRHPIIGHAVSDDLTNWTVVRDALIVSDSPAFDSWTTWTGSVIQDDNGLWWMFYTGTSREDGGDVQTVGAATSTDLMEWTKLSSEPMVSADERWYEKLDKTIWHDEAWRDPWVFRFENDPSTWHMLVTARAKHGEPATRGVLGHATSTDLLNWDVQPPLSAPGQGFGQLEVFQFELVDGVPVLVFCCGWRELSEERRAEFGQRDATYSVAVNADLSDIDFNKAKAFEDPLVYAARIIKGKDGWYLIGFVNEVNGEFVGELCDPVPVTATVEAGLVRR